MRRLTVAALAATLAWATMGAQSCGTTTTKTNGTPSGHAKAPSRATLGSAITLDGQQGGEKIQVTVTRLVDPLTAGQYDQPTAGSRFVGVQLTLRNVGTANYNDSPANDAKLISSTGEQAGRAVVTGGTCTTDFGSSVNLPPGETQQGCIPFELRQGQRPRLFQFTPDSGFSSSTGEWAVR